MREIAFGMILFAVCGCGEKPPPPLPDTGAKDTAAAFYGALIAGESVNAYAILDDVSRRRVSAEQFARLVQSYTRNLGFSANKVYIRSCQEQGEAATAHVLLTGHSHRYSDGITLHRVAEGKWGVTLPANFGIRAK